MPVAETTRQKSSGQSTRIGMIRSATAGSDPSDTGLRLEQQIVDVSRAIAEERERLLGRILAGAGSGELRRIQVNVTETAICLSGNVSSYYNKQLAQETLRPYADGLQIDNQIAVLM